MRLSWRSSLPFAAAALLAALQAPNYRVTYRLRVLQPAAGAGAGGGADTQLLASSVVTGPPETNLRLSLRTPGAELRGLLGTLPEPDTVNLAALFLTLAAAVAVFRFRWNMLAVLGACAAAGIDAGEASVVRTQSVMT